MRLKRSLFLLTIACLSIAQAGAQKLPERDSLMRRYAESAPRDTVRVKLLYNLSRVYRLAAPDSAIAFAKEAHALATALDDKKGIAISLNAIGVAYFYKGDYPAAQEYQRNALDYAQSRHLPVQVANALNSLALAYQYQGNYIAALEAYLKALQSEEALHNYFGQVKVLTNIGLLWKRQGNYDNSIVYTKRALALCDSLQDSRGVKASLYNNLGLIFIERKRFSEALDFLQQSLVLNRELKNQIFVANSLGNLGYCYLNMDRLKEAEQYIQQGLVLAREIDYTEAFEKALLNLGEVYVKQNKASLALPLMKESAALARKYNNKENILLTYQGLAAAYKGLGQMPLAYDYLEKAFVLADSLKNADNTKRIVELQKSYELRQKESEIALLEKDGALKKAALKEEQNLRYELIGLIAGLGILAASIYGSMRSKALLNEKLKTQNHELNTQRELIERINKDLKAQALRAQMNPHFIFNALNSIQFLILQKESTHAFDYLAKFALLLRKVMDNSDHHLIPLSEEIEILTLYLQLESLRFDGSFDYAIHVPEQIIRSAKIPPLVLQPYVENAIVHGLMPKPESRQLTVTFSQESNALLCEIKDNGIGRVEAREIRNRKNKAFVSKGMDYTAERIALMNRMTDGRSEVTVTDLHENGKASGTLVTILFAYA